MEAGGELSPSEFPQGGRPVELAFTPLVEASGRSIDQPKMLRVGLSVFSLGGSCSRQRGNRFSCCRGGCIAKERKEVRGTFPITAPTHRKQASVPVSSGIGTALSTSIDVGGPAETGARTRGFLKISHSPRAGELDSVHSGEPHRGSSPESERACC